MERELNSRRYTKSHHEVSYDRHKSRRSSRDRYRDRENLDSPSHYRERICDENLFRDNGVIRNQFNGDDRHLRNRYQHEKDRDVHRDMKIRDKSKLKDPNLAERYDDPRDGKPIAVKGKGMNTESFDPTSTLVRIMKNYLRFKFSKLFEKGETGYESYCWSQTSSF
jgi:hypothetical protein